MPTHSVLDARNNLSRLIADARSGIEVVITNRGIPVAQITSIGSVDAAPTGSALVEWIEANPLPERLARSRRDIDEQLRQLRDGWE